MNDLATQSLGSNQIRTVDVAALVERQNCRKLLYPLLAWGVFIMVLDGFAMAVLPLAAPFIMHEWGSDRSSFGVVFGIAQAGILVGAAFLGLLADRVGRRPVILGGVLLFGAMSLVVPLTQSVGELAVVRFVAACTLGGVKPVLYSLAIESAPLRLRSWVVAVVYAGVSIGQLLAGLVAASAISTYGWRSMFFVAAALPIAAVVVLFFVLPESLRFLARRSERKWQLVEQLRRISRSATFSIHDRFLASDELDDAPSTRGFRPSQLFEGHLFRITLLIWVCEICASVVTFCFYSWTPVLARGMGASASQASYAVAAFSAGAVVGPLVLSALVDRVGPQWILIASGAGAAALVVGSVASLSASALLGFFFVVGFFVVGIQLSLAAMFMQCYPTRIRANAVGWMILIGGIGSIGSPILFGDLLQAGVGANMVLAITAIPMSLMAAPIALLLSDYRKHRARLGTAQESPTFEVLERV